MKLTTCLAPIAILPSLLLAIGCSEADPAGGSDLPSDTGARTQGSAAPQSVTNPAGAQNSVGNTQVATSGKGQSGSADATYDASAQSYSEGAPPANVSMSTSAAGSAGLAVTQQQAAPPIAAEPQPAGAGGAAAETTVEPAPVEASAPSTNPYVDVQYDPMSTFAVDVDTASYDIFRRDINNGILPDTQTVRLEEFVNYFNYDYPAPEADAEQPFSISLAAAPNLIDNGTTLLRVGIQGELPPEFEKKPANLVFLIDVSGSMQSAEKLPLVQSVLDQTVGILEPEDTVSIVTYASGTGVRLEPTPASEADTIRGVVDALSAGGSTNGAGGIQLAYDQARNAFIEGGINHVILCTDGDFNVGVSSTQGLVDLIEEERKTGITFTALGFGSNNNDAMMEAVSNAGNGVYGVIASEAQAETYVAERLLHNLTFIAKDVKIQVEFNPEHVMAYRLLGYEDRAIADQDFRNDTVDAGEIGAGHRVTALYEVVPAGGSVPDIEGAPAMETGDAFTGESEVAPEQMVLVKIRYKDVDATSQDAAYEVNQGLTPEDVAESPSDLDEDFQWAVAVAAFAEILKNSPYASMSNLDQIDAIVTAQEDRDNDRGEFAQLFSAARPMLDAR